MRRCARQGERRRHDLVLTASHDVGCVRLQTRWTREPSLAEDLGFFARRAIGQVALAGTPHGSEVVAQQLADLGVWRTRVDESIAALISSMGGRMNVDAGAIGPEHAV